MNLFFYGVLLQSVADWPFLEGLGPGTPATTAGALYAIPSGSVWYPALTLAPQGNTTSVQGTLHEAGEVDIAAVDEFEGPDYTRKLVSIDGWQGLGDRLAEAYVWTADLPEDAVPIPHGDFVRWLKETGHKPLSSS